VAKRKKPRVITPELVHKENFIAEELRRMAGRGSLVNERYALAYLCEAMLILLERTSPSGDGK